LLLPVSLSLTNHLGVLSHVGGSLVISFCLVSRHHGSVKTAVIVLAEKSRRRNSYGRGLLNEEQNDKYPTNLPTILSRKQQQENSVEDKPEPMKAKLTKSPGSPSKGSPSSSADDLGACAVDTTLNDPAIPGVTALEYLGIGYNLIEGNPRGSDITELDPGFRSGVIKLEKSKNSLTSNNEFSVPLGVELRYLTSCEFSSKATEVSDVFDYQRRLSRESKFSASGGISGALKGISGQFDVSFSKSERFESFQKDSFRTKNTEFESSAICTEYEGRLNSYFDHKTRHNFNMAISTLDYPFDEGNKTHVDAYKKFIAEYGTHYVSKVVLGAKLVYTVVMGSNAVSKLREKKVDVATTIGAKAMFKFSKLPGNEKSDTITNSGDNNNLISIMNPSPNKDGEGEDDSKDGRRRLAASVSVQGSFEKSTSKSESTRQLDEIKREVSDTKRLQLLMNSK